jgi:ethanolamine permease
VVTYFSAQYAAAIMSDLTGFSLINLGLARVWWAVLYVVFVLLNAAGAQVSFKFAIVVSIISVAILALFAGVAIFSGKVNLASLFDIAPVDGGSAFLPMGWLPILFTMWLFLGIEELPLAAEEAHWSGHPQAGTLRDAHPVGHRPDRGGAQPV